MQSLLGLTYWWFAHVCIIFWKVIFPFHAKLHEDKGKSIHLVVVVLGIIISLTTPSLAFIWKDGYTLGRYPPLLCVPVNTDLTYYGLLLPISLTITIGITQLIIVLHTIRQVFFIVHCHNEIITIKPPESTEIKIVSA